jgi:dienelactone hydrolase
MNLDAGPLTTHVTIPSGAATLDAALTFPPAAKGIVVFAHDIWSPQNSRRDQLVARRLDESSFATLLFAFLTQDEERDDDRGELRSDVGFLAGRLGDATDWVLRHPEARRLHVGYYGAGIGSAAAFIVASERSAVVHAIVSRGGRTDLAGTAIGRIAAPTLLVVGSEDPWLVELNREAYERLPCDRQLEIVPGATRQLDEPGALDAVANLAAGWFRQFLRP